MNQIKIGVSSCLLGEKVRFDGGHKHDPYITETLGEFFSFVSVCPEVECGMPVPREAMRLEGNPENPRLVTNKTFKDMTEQMMKFSVLKNAELKSADLCGFIFKKDSPSSGLHRVKVYNSGAPAKNGRGLFAAVVVKTFPLLPVEEEGRLHDAAIRENFIERVFAYRRWKDFTASKPGLGALVDFHTAHKLLIMSHSVQAYRDMGKIVAHGKEKSFADLLTIYETAFMNALTVQATVKKNVNVLMHIMGYFKNNISSEEKAELLALIDDYSRRIIPLIVPVTMLKHYVRKYKQSYLSGQIYLSPHPSELMLRNHV
jgi:uncharacterized protein YbgA (DUF1722 family)/uncharacterized protein YbbK (DUF523 family)